MPRRRLINGALGGFLGTLVSRYSELNGYWLLGFLALQRKALEIDLRHGGERATDSPEDHFSELASRKFNEQLIKSRVAPVWVASARLNVIWSEELVGGFVGGVMQDGYRATFAASVESDLGRTWSRAKHVFVAPHNPRLESRSATAV